MSLYTQSTKKVKIHPQTFVPIWFKNYSSKSIDLVKRNIFLSTKAISVSGFADKIKKTKKTIENSLWELEDSVMSVSEEESNKS